MTSWSPPVVVVFDVNETLSDMSSMGARFTDVGLRAELAQAWFAAVLRDGFALTAVGSFARFADLAAHHFRRLAATADLTRGLDQATEHVLSGFLALPVHPDVPAGVRSLREAGHRLVTLSNGASTVADALLGSAGLRDHFERLLTVEDAGVWKPDRLAYEHAARTCGVDLPQMMLVAVHPWDIDGAARAGMSTAWIDRAGSPYPPFFTEPTVTVRALSELAAALDASPR